MNLARAYLVSQLSTMPNIFTFRQQDKRYGRLKMKAIADFINELNSDADDHPLSVAKIKQKWFNLKSISKK